MDNNLNQDIWQQPVNPMPEQPKKPNYDVPALVLGIVSAIFAFVSSCFICCAPIPLVTGIIGIVFVFITNKNGYQWNAMRIVALILNIVAILGLILWFVYLIIFMNSPVGQAYIEEYMNIYNELMSDPSLGGAYYN